MTSQRFRTFCHRREIRSNSLLLVCNRFAFRKRASPLIQTSLTNSSADDIKHLIGDVGEVLKSTPENLRSWVLITFSRQESSELGKPQNGFS